MYPTERQVVPVVGKYCKTALCMVSLYRSVSNKEKIPSGKGPVVNLGAMLTALAYSLTVKLEYHLFQRTLNTGSKICYEGHIRVERLTRYILAALSSICDFSAP